MTIANSASLATTAPRVESGVQAVNQVARHKPHLQPWHVGCLHRGMRDQIYDRLLSLLSDEQGASMAEYALLLAVIAVGTMGAMIAMKDQILALFQQDLVSD